MKNVWLKILFIPLLFITACLIAGLYGAVHNQISYTVGPVYFHEYKFTQFNMVHLQNRVGASIIGIEASWQMGFIIGLFLIFTGLIIPGWKAYVLSVLKSFGIAAGTALICGLAALGIACLVVTEANAGEVVRYGSSISDPVGFLRAGAMHNFSYLGGGLGIIIGIVFLIFERRRVKKKLT